MEDGSEPEDIVDDTEDADILDSILDRFPPPGVQVFSTEGAYQFYLFPIVLQDNNKCVKLQN